MLWDLWSTGAIGVQSVTLTCLSHEIINFNPKSLDYLYEVHNVRVPQGHLRVGGANIFQKGATDTAYPPAPVFCIFLLLGFSWS